MTRAGRLILCAWTAGGVLAAVAQQAAADPVQRSGAGSGEPSAILGPVYPQPVDSQPAAAQPALVSQPKPARALPSQAIESTPLGAALAVAGSDAAAGAVESTSPMQLGASAGRTIASLMGVLAVIFVIAVGMRKLSRVRGGLAAQLGAGGRAPSGVLEVLGRYPVGHGQQLVLLKLDRRVLLLAQGAGSRRGGGGGFQTLCEVTDPEEIAGLLVKTRDERQESLAARFQTTLRDADQRTAAALASADAHAAFEGLADHENPYAESHDAPRHADRPVDTSPLRARLASMRARDSRVGELEAWA